MPASILEEVGDLLEAAPTRKPPPSTTALLRIGPRRAGLGDNGVISYVCTACGHSWS